MTEATPPRARSSIPAGNLAERRLPPITALLVASLAMMLAGGVVMAAHLPHHPPLAAPTGLLAGGGCLTIAAMALLARIRPFGWNVFWLVARWALLAYLVIAALLAYVFIYDKTSGATLVVLVATLVVFAVDVPSLMAFTVARYQATEPQPDANG